MNFSVFFGLLFISMAFAAEESQQNDMKSIESTDSAVAVVGRVFLYSPPNEGGHKDTNKVVQRGQDSLPQWLSCNEDKSLLHGVPSWRDRGDVLIDFQSNDGTVTHSLKIEVKDLRDEALHLPSRSNNTKTTTYSKPKCPKGLPVAAASIVLDYHLEKVTGERRVEIMNKVSDFVDVDVKSLHMLAGKGHNTAFGLKDVITVTAGPGNVADSSQPGVVISWQIGCGIDIPIAGVRIASFLKSSTETGTFATVLGLPVTDWHVSIGYPKEPRQRARRQVAQDKTPKVVKRSTKRNVRAVQVTATPTTTVAPPTSVVASVTITVTRTSSVVPTSTVAPTTTPIAPTTTEKPTTTKPPTTTEKLTTTQPPTTTEKPTTTKAPTTTEKPTTTKPPTTTEKPTTTKPPTTTERPTTTEESTTTKPPTTTEKPTTTARSTTTEKPTTTERPTTTTKPPTTTEEPTTPVQPTTTTKPPTTTAKPTTTEKTTTTTSPSTTEPITARVLISTKETTTQKPSTKTKKPSTKKITAEPSVKPSTESESNPIVKNPLGELDVYRGQELRFHIPFDTFYDNKDKFTPNLTLSMKTDKWTSLSEVPWIKFDAEEQVVYGFPVDEDTIRTHKFFIIAADSDGEEGYAALIVNVIDDSSVTYNHRFGLVLDYDYEKFNNDLNIRVQLLSKLAEYFEVNASSIRAMSFTEGSVIFDFQFDSSVAPFDECDFALREKFLSEDVDEDGDSVNPDLKKALEPEFPVKSGTYKGLGPCAAGVVVDPVTEQRSGKWKTYIIIPVVILVIVLLVIGACLFVIMRSRRRRKFSLDDQKLFVDKKKPAVLQEEYEVQERLLKQPLVLPNEKPPLAPPVYPRSPSLKHANGEPPQSPGYQAPSFASSRQPSNQGTPSGNSPRKPGYSGYRLPPAYVPP